MKVPEHRVVGGVVVFLWSVGLLLAFPWSTDMTKGPSIQPLERLMPPPPGVLSLRGEMPLSRDDAAERLTNPLRRLPAVLEGGRQLFETYCIVCHGPTAQGDGPVGRKFGVKIPPLTLDPVKRHPDGYLYGTIRQGGFSMPSYAEVMTPEERWMVVQYVRSLQQR